MRPRWSPRASSPTSRRALHKAGRPGLRSIFRRWLLAVVTLAFLVTAGASFVVITETSKGAASESMGSEIGYLGRQLSERDVSAAELLDGYSVEIDGVIAIFKNGALVAADDGHYREGDPLKDYLDLTDEEIGRLSSTGEMLQIVYDEDAFDLDDIVGEVNFEELEAGPISTRIAYVRVGSFGDYTVMMLLPATMVYDDRTSTMLWLTLSAFVLLLVVFVAASRLLGSIVVRRIDETNGVLGRITGATWARASTSATAASSRRFPTA